jgi:hypothetical protein
MTVRPPTSGAAKNCQTEISQHCEAFCATTLAGPSGRSAILASRWLSIPACSIITPLGTPVEPEVNIT